MSREDQQKWRLKMLRFWEENLEVRLAGIRASKEKLEEQMRETFHSISDGQYAELLYKLFGKERVEKELEEFLEFDFFPRSGGGIGMQRLMTALS